MRITTGSVADFLSNLETGTVWQGRIYYERSSRPMCGKSKRDATSFEVCYQLSTVLNIGDDGQALVVCGVDCGIDRLTGDGELEGTEEQKKNHEQVVKWCNAHGVRLLPGVLDQ